MALRLERLPESPVSPAAVARPARTSDFLVLVIKAQGARERIERVLAERLEMVSARQARILIPAGAVIGKLLLDQFNTTSSSRSAVAAASTARTRQQLQATPRVNQVGSAPDELPRVLPKYV